jgi:hypothetical protein
MGATGPKGDAGPAGPKGDPGTSGAYSEDLGSFAGFTASVYSGAITNGRPGAHAICAAAFSGAHLCHVAEFVQANVAVSTPGTGAWIDASIFVEGSEAITNNGMPGSGRNYSSIQVCSSWSSAASAGAGTIIDNRGGVASDACSSSHALACCNTPSKTRFAGFTTITTTGAGGGRSAMHALCARTFANAHLCHVAEYIRANSAVTVPTGGAWLDPSVGSGYATSSRTNVAMPSSGRHLLATTTCDSWTKSVGLVAGTSVSVNGDIGSSTSCGVARSAACCY